MELTGEKVFNAPREEVYRRLHDPAVMRKAIPGCQRLQKVADDRHEAELALKIGPITATFVTSVTTFNEDPPMGFSVNARGEASGRIGGASANIHIALAPIDDTATNLAYHVSAVPFDEVAMLPSEVLDKKARVLVAEFFSRLKLLLEPDDILATPYAAATTPAPAFETYAEPIIEEPVTQRRASEEAAEVAEAAPRSPLKKPVSPKGLRDDEELTAVPRAVPEASRIPLRTNEDRLDAGGLPMREEPQTLPPMIGAEVGPGTQLTTKGDDWYTNRRDNPITPAKPAKRAPPEERRIIPRWVFVTIGILLIVWLLSLGGP